MRNKVFLIGRLTKESEVRPSTTGSSVYTNSIAVQRKLKNQYGEYETDFINFIAYGALADILGQYTKKGDKIGIEGRIQTGSYLNQEGQKIYTTNVVVEGFEFMQNKPEEEKTFKIEEDDLPF